MNINFIVNKTVDCDYDQRHLEILQVLEPNFIEGDGDEEGEQQTG